MAYQSACLERTLIANRWKLSGRKIVVTTIQVLLVKKRSQEIREWMSVFYHIGRYMSIAASAQARWMPKRFDTTTVDGKNLVIHDWNPFVLATAL